MKRISAVLTMVLFSALLVAPVSAEWNNPKQLTFNTADDGVPSISGDGAKVAFASDVDGYLEIFVINFDGTGLKQLTFNNATDFWPSISSDGTKIAFMSDVDGDWEIFVVNSDGTGLKQLTFNTADDGVPSISGDGAKIAFNSNVDGDNEIFVISQDVEPPSIALTVSLVNGTEIKSSTCPVSWASTDTGSGIDHHEVRLDNGAWTEIGAASTYTFTGLNDGRHEFSIKAVDKSGNSRILSLSIVTNTSPIGGPGYTEEALLGVTIGAVVGGLLANKFRKRPKKPSAAEKVGSSLSGVDVRTCTNCGEIIPAKAKFCTACGASQIEETK